MGSLKVITLFTSVFMLFIESGQAQDASMATMGMTTMGMPAMEDWKIVAIVVPCVVGGLAIIICICCCCCCHGGAAGAGGAGANMMCCNPNGGCGPGCDPNCCGPAGCDPNGCCGPHGSNACCGPQCDANACCGPQCDANACCGPMCHPATCCGPECCGPCCCPVHTAAAPVVTQYATRGQIWPQQAYDYRCGPPGAIGASNQCNAPVSNVSNVPVNGGIYGRSMDAGYSSGPVYGGGPAFGGGAQCGPCQQQPRYPSRF